MMVHILGFMKWHIYSFIVDMSLGISKYFDEAMLTPKNTSVLIGWGPHLPIVTE